MITRSSITIEMLNADITSLRFNVPFSTNKITLASATSTLLQSRRLKLGSRVKAKTGVDLIVIGAFKDTLCLYDPQLRELRMFLDSGLQYHEDHVYETASLEMLKDIFFSTSDYADLLRKRNEKTYFLKNDAYVVKIPAPDNKLGSGVYSDVYAGFFEGKNIAIKRAKAGQRINSTRFELMILMYVQMLMDTDGVRNDFIITCYGAGTRYSVRDLLFELMPLTLEKYVLSEKCHNELLYTYFCDIIFALQYLHDRCRVVHGDLKPANIFIGPHSERDSSARIGDFGFADTAELPWQRPNPPGSPLYMSPEILSKQAKTTTCSDIYALGMTMVYAVTRNDPYPDVKTSRELISRVVQCGIKPFISSAAFAAHPKLVSTSRWCAESRPDFRPTAAELKLEFSTPHHLISERLGMFSNSNVSLGGDVAGALSRKRALTNQ